jgi:hypothetical protein
MKKLFLIPLFLLVFSACKKEDPDGQLTVWSSDPNTAQITVKIDGADAGLITTTYASQPECGATGCVTANLPKGNHNITATDGTFEWSGSMNVEAGKCNVFELN